MRYEGIVYFKPPKHHSFQGEPVPGSPEWFELTQDEINMMLAQMDGIPLITEHGATRTRIGKVERAFMQDGNACVHISLDDSQVGKNARLLIEKGICQGLSLTHDRSTMKPVDLSICTEGARPRTGITSRLQDPASKASPQTDSPTPQTNSHFHNPTHTTSVQQADLSSVAASFNRGCSFVKASFSHLRPVPMNTAPTSTPAAAPQNLAQNENVMNQALNMAISHLVKQHYETTAREQQQIAQNQGQSMGMQDSTAGRTYTDTTNVMQYTTPPGTMPKAGQPHPYRASTDSTGLTNNVPVADPNLSMNTALEFAEKLVSIIHRPNNNNANTAMDATHQQTATPTVVAASNNAPPSASLAAPESSASSSSSSSSSSDTAMDTQETASEGAGKGQKRKAGAGTDDSSEDVINKLVSSRGTISDADKSKLLEKVTEEQRQRLELEQELQRLRDEVKEHDSLNRSLQGQFVDTLVPFLESVMGGRNALGDDDRQRLNRAVQSKQSLPLMNAMQPLLVKASRTMATRTFEQQSMNGLPQRLRSQVELYNALKKLHQPGATPAVAGMMGTNAADPIPPQQHQVIQPQTPTQTPPVKAWQQAPSVRDIQRMQALGMYQGTPAYQPAAMPVVPAAPVPTQVQASVNHKRRRFNPFALDEDEITAPSGDTSVGVVNCKEIYDRHKVLYPGYNQSRPFQADA